jgi:hypothetical protein
MQILRSLETARSISRGVLACSSIVSFICRSVITAAPISERAERERARFTAPPEMALTTPPKLSKGVVPLLLDAFITCRFARAESLCFATQSSTRCSCSIPMPSVRNLSPEYVSRRAVPALFHDPSWHVLGRDPHDFVVHGFALFGGYKVGAAAEYLALEMGSAWRAVPDGDRKGVCGGSRFAAFGLSRRRGGESVPRRSRNSSPEV